MSAEAPAYECSSLPCSLPKQTKKKKHLHLCVSLELSSCQTAQEPSAWEDTKGVLQSSCQMQSHQMQITAPCTWKHTHTVLCIFVMRSEGWPQLYSRGFLNTHMRESQLSINNELLKGLMSGLSVSQDFVLVVGRVHYKRQGWFIIKLGNGECVIPSAWFQKAFEMQTGGRHR